MHTYKQETKQLKKKERNKTPKIDKLNLSKHKQNKTKKPTNKQKACVKVQKQNKKQKQKHVILKIVNVKNLS